MNAKQENKLSMYLVVREICRKNSAAWTSVPAYAEAVALFEDKIELIEDALERQEVRIKGITATKTKLREQLIASALEVCKGIKAYADVIGDETLSDTVNYSFGVMLKTRDTVLVQRCQIIYEKALEHSAALLSFGISEANIGKLQEGIVAFDASVSAPRAAVTNRKNATHDIESLLEEADSVLNNRLDNIMETLKGTQPTFFDKYFNARKIIDLGRRGTALSVVVKDKKDGKLLSKAVVEITLSDELGTRVEKGETEKNGEIVFQELVAGVVDIVVTVAGYKRGIEKSYIRRGKTNRIEVGLEKEQSG